MKTMKTKSLGDVERERYFTLLNKNSFGNICVKKDSSIKLQNKMYSFSSAF